MTAADPHHLANNLVNKGLSPYLKDRVPPNLGREAFSSIRRRLSADNLPGVLHSEEVFSRALTNSIDYLSKQGGERVRNPRAWFLTICRNESLAYMKELTPLLPLKVVLEGKKPLSEMPVPSDERVLKEVREAVRQLSPRQQELIRLDLYECQSPQEIQRKMGISAAYFKKLKHQAFRALRETLLLFIDNIDL